MATQNWQQRGMKLIESSVVQKLVRTLSLMASSWYTYLASAKTIKRRLSPWRVPPLRCLGHPKPIGVACDLLGQCAPSRLRDVPLQLSSCLSNWPQENSSGMFVPRLFLEIVSKAVNRSSPRPGSSGCNERSADKQMIDSQLSGFAMGLRAYPI